MGESKRRKDIAAMTKEEREAKGLELGTTIRGWHENQKTLNKEAKRAKVGRVFWDGEKQGPYRRPDAK